MATEVLSYTEGGDRTVVLKENSQSATASAKTESGLPSLRITEIASLVSKLFNYLNRAYYRPKRENQKDRYQLKGETAK